MAYLRCANDQRVIVETEIAAQLAELNAVLRELQATLGKLGSAKERPVSLFGAIFGGP
jgi:hypothetical protein